MQQARARGWGKRLRVVFGGELHEERLLCGSGPADRCGGFGLRSGSLVDHTRTMSDVMSEPWKFSMCRSLSVPRVVCVCGDRGRVSFGRVSHLSRSFDSGRDGVQFGDGISASGSCCRIISCAAADVHISRGEWRIARSVDLMWAGSIETLGPNGGARQIEWRPARNGL